MKFAWPVPGNQPITQTSADHLARGGGEAVDIACPSGTPWLACHDGHIAFNGIAGDAGFSVWLQWLNAETDTIWRARYAHGDQLGPLAVGTEVTAGTIIGWVGDTDTGLTGLSTGPHLHLALEGFTGNAGVRVQPEGFLTSGTEYEGGGATMTDEPEDGGGLETLTLTFKERAEALALLNLIYGVGKVLTKEQRTRQTRSSLGQQVKDAAVRLRELMGLLYAVLGL